MKKKSYLCTILSLTLNFIEKSNTNHMCSFRPEGLGVALVTPFLDNLEIDYDALRRILNNIIAGKADFIVVLGTTGETPTLTAEERREVSRFVADYTAGRIPLVLGVGGNCTSAVCDQLRSEDLTGYEAILSVAPFYNKPSQPGLIAHFRAIADASPLPVVLYNIPGRTGVNMTAQTTLTLAEHPNIVGVKEASGNLEQMKEILEESPADFAVISGDDAITLELMKYGGKGVISVIANALPHMMHRLTQAASQKNYEEAQKANEVMQPYYKPLFADGNPAGIKALLSIMGIADNTLRLPLVKVTQSTYDTLAAIYNR